MKGDPCKVCGCTDLNLVDGFFYCVECGTQDVNVRETVVEELDLAEGAFNFKKPRTTKIKKVVQDGDTVSPEWHKWHCYNYIMAGLADEVVKLGASPSFKTKVLWLWSMYMKKHQKRQELGLPAEDDDAEDSSEDEFDRMKKMSYGPSKVKAFVFEDIKNALFFTILYLALNFDKSDIQMTDLIRFVREQRLSYNDCAKFVPKDIDVYLVDDFSTLICTAKPSALYFGLYAMQFIKKFHLGPPVLPDLKKMADRFITELCLPDDFKSLIYSLMQLVPCDDLILDEINMKAMKRVPFYECVIMSYIVVGLKMCFGLDDDYEIKLSDVVDQINIENCHMKCYKFGIFTSDRLFSFRQWCHFLKLRKVVLCKFYWPIAQLSDMDIDDYVYMEQKKTPTVYDLKLLESTSVADEITMNILNKIDENHEVNVIPKSAFPHTLTPLTTYTDVVLEHYKDPELKLLLSEDFTKYSLKYATEKLDLRLSDNAENIVVGVNESGKIVEPKVKGKMTFNRHDPSMVYVRNCENKNWLTTNPPTLDHIKKVINDDTSDKENDNNVSSENQSFKLVPEISKTDRGSVKDDAVTPNKVFLQEDKNINIFDDDFDELEEYEENKDNVSIKTEPIDEDIPETNNDINNHGMANNDFLSNLDQDNDDNLSHIGNNIDSLFNSKTFNREETIRELVLFSCKKYRIPIPPEYKIKKEKQITRTRETRTSEPKPKKNKFSSAEIQAKIYYLLSAYHENLERVIFANLANARPLDYTRNNIDSTEHDADDEDDGNLDINTTFDLQTIDESAVNTDSSILLVENEVIESHQKDDPDLNTQADLFDENVYDIKQLYLKVQQADNEIDVNISTDEEIEKLLDKKIDECITVQSKNIDAKDECIGLKSKNIVEEEKLEEIDDDETLEEVDDDENFEEIDDVGDDSLAGIPLSVIKKEKNRCLRKQRILKEYKQLEYLIKNRKDIQKFNYWSRHPVDIFRSCIQKCDDELKENFPKSFAFVVEECAAILEYDTLPLCKSVFFLERLLFSKLNRN